LRFLLRSARDARSGTFHRLDLAFGASMLLAAVGTAVGSAVRDEVVQRFRRGAGRPDLGVLAVNLAACALAGLASGAMPHAAPALAPTLAPTLVPTLALFLVIGVAGGLSTWSSLAVDVAAALASRRWARVALHVPGAFAIALAAYLAARALAGGLA